MLIMTVLYQQFCMETLNIADFCQLFCEKFSTIFLCNLLHQGIKSTGPFTDVPEKSTAEGNMHGELKIFMEIKMEN